MYVNYITESEAFIRHARENQYTGSEQLLWRALFTICNERAGRNEGAWPDGFISVTNTELLSWLPYGENTLMAARASITNPAKHQPVLIDYDKGKKNSKAPRYRLHYLSHMDAGAADDPNAFYRKNGGNMGGKAGGNMGGNPWGKDRGNMGGIIQTKQDQGKPNGDKKLYYNKAWKHDARAQRAVALNILDALPGLEPDGYPHTSDDICRYLALGMQPEDVLAGLSECRKGHYVAAHLHSHAVYLGLEAEEA